MKRGILFAVLLMPALALVGCAGGRSPATVGPTSRPPAQTAGTAAPTPSPTPTPSAGPTAQPTPKLFQTEVAHMENPLVVIYKGRRLLELYDGEKLMARVKVALGSAPVGQKQREGDGRTPEGHYIACLRNDKSKYHLSIGISYPNADDARRGLDAGLISRGQYDDILSASAAGRRPPWNTPLGGEIMLHGGGTASDWTAGCVAVNEGDMEYLWKHIPLGTKVEIRP